MEALAFILLMLSLNAWGALVVGMVWPGIFSGKLFGGGVRKQIAKRFALLAIVTGIVGTGLVLPMAGEETEGTKPETMLADTHQRERPRGPQKDWRNVTALSGENDQQTALFTLPAGDGRIRYAVEGDRHAVFAVFVVPEGKSIERDGGTPEAMLTGPQPGDTTYAHVAAGQYYLDITAANATWQVAIDAAN